MIAVIMAGGRGTRIASVCSEVPKPMIPVMGKPILEYELDCLKRNGIKEIVLVVGYLKHIIQDYFGNGSRFGVRIRYIEEEEPLGTAGALYYLKDDLKEDFLLLCGDLVFDADLNRFYSFHKKKGGLATLFTHPNSHPYDSGIVVADGEGRVTGWLHKEEERLFYRNRVNAGLHILSPKLLSGFEEPVKRDLDREILKPLIPSGGLYAYDSPEYVKDMGTPDRLLAVEEDLRSGKVAAKNLSVQQRAIFLDRDGTINRYVGFLRSPDEFELEEGAAAAIRKINESGYLAIVVSNQPVVARGEVTEEELRIIHDKMETLLGREGAYLDAVYYCPHHPHKGYAGERAELKFDCDCRKPKPGLVLRAAKDFHIDLASSWIVGDGEADLLCGKNAGLRTALIREDGRADVSGRNLADCVDKLFQFISENGNERYHP